MFIEVILTIVTISFLMALISLKRIGQKKEIEEAKKDLSRSRVLYQEDYSSPESSSSSS